VAQGPADLSPPARSVNPPDSRPCPTPELARPTKTREASHDLPRLGRTLKNVTHDGYFGGPGGGDACVGWMVQALLLGVDEKLVVFCYFARVLGVDSNPFYFVLLSPLSSWTAPRKAKVGS
jgi:hypothetical protein